MGNRLGTLVVGLLALCFTSCGRQGTEAHPELHIAAAANLAGMFGKLSAAYEKRAGVRLAPSFGSTAQLATQIENGAPYDLFLAADVEHVDLLVEKGFVNSRSIYARGRLVLWAPRRTDIRSLEDLEERT